MAQERGIKTWAKVYITNGYDYDLYAERDDVAETKEANMEDLIAGLDGEIATDDCILLCTQEGSLALKAGGSIKTEPDGEPDNQGNTRHKVTVELMIDGLQAIATVAAQAALLAMSKDRVNVFVVDDKLLTVTKAKNVQLNKAHSTVIGETAVDTWTGENTGDEDKIFQFAPLPKDAADFD
jgi:hypothetical protein